MNLSDIQKINEGKKIKFTQPAISTCVFKSSIGPFLEFNEYEIIKDLAELVKKNDKILSIDCDGFHYSKEVIVIKKKSNRGRKPSINTIEKRKRKENGSRFKSQITFVVIVGDKNVTNKVFHNGKVITPGINSDRDIHDLLKSLEVLVELFGEFYKRKFSYELLDISLVYHKFKINNNKFTLDIKHNLLRLLNELIDKNEGLKENLLVLKKNKKTEEYITELTKDDLNECSNYTIQDIENYVHACSLGAGKNCISIGIAYKGKKHGKSKYETNVRIFHKGSINISGTQKKFNIILITAWLSDFLNRHYKDIIYKTRCNKCFYVECEECEEKKYCNKCEFCIKCRKYYLN